MTPKELHERYVYLGMVRDSDAQAALFAEDGVLEMPLAADGTPVRVEGRENVRAYLKELHAQLPAPQPGHGVDFARSRSVLHLTEDPDVFIAEIDAALTVDGVPTTTMSLVHIYRTRDGEFVQIRDYYR